MFIDAILIGLLCYLGALSSPWLLGLTGGWYLITRPLVSGMLVGLILGDMKTGIIIGVAVQAVYIAMVTPGGSMPADLNFVAYPAIALGIGRMWRWIAVTSAGCGLTAPSGRRRRTLFYVSCRPLLPSILARSTSASLWRACRKWCFPA